MPKISFLLPVYNGAQFISETMNSLLAQTHDDFDIFVIDDGSTDDTAEIIHRYDDLRIKYVFQENQGLVPTLNAGLQLLDCELVARIDADDICSPERLRIQESFMDFTQANAVSGKAVNIDTSGNVLGINTPEKDFFYKDTQFIPAREPYLPHPFLMAKLDVMKQVGGFRNAHLAEDSDLCWRLDQMDRTALQTVILGQYRIHDVSVSNASTAGGRVQAFYSQLAALNAARRNERKDEVSYKHTIAEAKEIATNFDGLVDAYADDLSAKETEHLRAAFVIKYLDISMWRYHQVTQSDLAYAYRSLDAVSLSDENKTKVQNILTSLRVRQPEIFAK